MTPEEMRQSSNRKFAQVIELMNDMNDMNYINEYKYDINE